MSATLGQTEVSTRNVSPSQAGYGQLTRTFLRISLLGFGGPNAHLALMLDEVVERKGWITREHFLHLMGITNLLPGPNSSEVAIHIGYTQRGWRGALTTGLAFLSPTLALVTVFSAIYFRYGTTPAVSGIFWGLKPMVLGVILAAGWKLAKAAITHDPIRSAERGAAEPEAEEERQARFSPTAIRTLLILLALGGGLAAFFGDRLEVPAMILGGLISWIFLRGPSTAREPLRLGTGAISFSQIGTAPASNSGTLGSSIVGIAAAAFGILGPLGQVFVTMLIAGAVLFGGGYMLVALLEPFVVESFGWLTADQFLDGIALTQAVPGPIVTLVAFVGFGVAGVPGALVATVGIYLPSFAAVLAVAPHLERWRAAEGVRAALRGVNAVVAGAILGVGFTLLPPALPDYLAGGLFLVALVGLVRFRVPAVWVMAGGLAAGAIHTAFQV